jgi:hypothetical protein
MLRRRFYDTLRTNKELPLLVSHLQREKSLPDAELVTQNSYFFGTPIIE